MHRAISMLEFQVGLLTFAVGWLVFPLVVGTTTAACTPQPSHAAETAYTAALLRCVDKAETLAESRSCRERVDEEWNVDAGAYR